ncbi:hypothetical protein RDI58_009995 [Solanum bulbocastanum]|uniref:Uncharacterized protein n=1 Tax=Solanum bulbocastanum TaxID=147425 RepID=A0AAN8YF10_SOLBU
MDSATTKALSTFILDLEKTNLF